MSPIQRVAKGHLKESLMQGFDEFWRQQCLKKECAWGKVIEWTFFSLSSVCKMKLGLREKRIRTDEQFKRGILSTWGL